MNFTKSLIGLSVVATVLFTTSISFADDNFQSVFSTGTDPDANLSIDDKELMAKGMWRDPRTGLIWARCNAMHEWTGSTCDGTKSSSYAGHSSWLEAMEAIGKLRLGGYSDWRMPSLDELNAILSCREKYNTDEVQKFSYNGRVIGGSVCHSYTSGGVFENKGFKNIYDARRVYSVSSGCNGDPLSNVRLETRDGRVLCDNRYEEEFEQGAMTLVVRGGQSNGEYELARKEADEIIANNNKTQAAEDAQAAKEKVANDAKAAIAKAKDNENYRKERELRKQRTIALRRSVKAGDNTSRGMVIEVRGDLVLIQKKELECLVMNVSVPHPFCAKYGGLVVTGQEWFNRNNISP